MKMTEKEFLLDAFWVITQVEANGSHEEWKKEQGLGIDLWLEYFHKTYYEVEFIKKGFNCTFDTDGKFQHDTECKGDCQKDGYVVGVDYAKGKDETIHTLYNHKGEVIGWSSLTAEELRKTYNEVKELRKMYNETHKDNK